MQLFLGLFIFYITINLASANDQALQLTAIEGKVEITGLTQGYDKSITNKKDGYIDFSLVAPSFTTESILQFDLSSIVSPQLDTVKALGQKFEIPSNISLPKQKESYILSVKINKPNFRLFVDKPGLHSITALHGRIKLKKAVDHIRKEKPIIDLINQFKYLGGDAIDVDTTSKIEAHILNIKKFKFNNKSIINAPDYDEGLSLVSLPLAFINESYHPTDIKYIKPGQSQVVSTHEDHPMFSLNVLTGTTSRFLSFNSGESPYEPSFLYKSSFNKVSLNLSPLDEEHTPIFLDFIPRPVVSWDQTDLLFIPPPIPEGVNPLATIIELVEATSFTSGKLILESKKTLWKATIPGWHESTPLPDFDLSRRNDIRYRYEVSFVATHDETTPELKKDINFNNFSLLTKNYLVIR